MKEIGVGLIGAGTVGGGVVKILNSRKSEFENAGLPMHLTRIVDTVAERFSSLPVGVAKCSGNVEDILGDPDIRIVVELVGGTTFARKVVLEALSRGKHVVTANKALIAEYGPELFDCASKNGRSLYFEASVGGGMPVIKTIREALVGNEIRSVKTIINGTSNYILTKMSTQGLSFEKVLLDAQQKGYAEKDPTLDIGGGDSGHKVAIIASLVSGGYVPFKKISIEGITGIGIEDIIFAKEMGYVIKLLGIVNKIPGSPLVDVRVHPAMLPLNHILASVGDVYNAVLIEGDSVGKIVLYGRGAGEMPTGSAVVSDIVDVTRNIMNSSEIRIPMDYYTFGTEISVMPIGEVESRYYLRFTVIDQPGILASIASILGAEGISIASVMQKEGYSDDSVPVIFLTHRAKDENIKRALTTISLKGLIRQDTRLIRIEE